MMAVLEEERRIGRERGFLLKGSGQVGLGVVRGVGV